MAATLLLLLAALTAVEAGRVLRDARRARRMNRAMHELRRPLQAIALSLESASPDLGGAESCLEQARAALRELDAAVNGRSDPRPVRRTPIADVLDALDRRWRFADVEVERGCAGVEIEADPIRLGAALDNLVVNALRHGSGMVRVRARTVAGNARFEVRDGGPSGPAAGDGRRRRDPRHGHGLRVVADVAAGHGGRADAGRARAGRRDAGSDLAAAARRGRRRMSRHGRAIAFAALAVLCGIASAGVASAYRDRVDEQLGETRPVLTLRASAHAGGRAARTRPRARAGRP